LSPDFSPSVPLTVPPPVSAGIELRAAGLLMLEGFAGAPIEGSLGDGLVRVGGNAVCAIVAVAEIKVSANAKRMVRTMSSPRRVTSGCNRDPR
jgi:hypothetical protein